MRELAQQRLGVAGGHAAREQPVAVLLVGVGVVAFSRRDVAAD